MNVLISVFAYFFCVNRELDYLIQYPCKENVEYRSLESRTFLDIYIIGSIYMLFILERIGAWICVTPMSFVSNIIHTA